MGVGWTLDIGQHRRGDSDTERRFGEPGRGRLPSRRPAPATATGPARKDSIDYRTENESFLRIQKTARTWTQPHGCYGTGSRDRVEARVDNDAYWQVWDTGGTRYEFGKSDYDQVIALKDSAGADHWPFFGEPGLEADSSRTYRIGAEYVWRRHELRVQRLLPGADRRHPRQQAGDRLRVSPVCRSLQPGNCPVFSGYHQSWKETYPHVIRYTTNPTQDDTHAEYRVVFDVQPKGFEDTHVHKFVAQSGYKLLGVQGRVSARRRRPGGDARIPLRRTPRSARACA